jgi:hypothetical protein
LSKVQANPKTEQANLLNPSYGPVNPHLSKVMETSPEVPIFFLGILCNLLDDLFNPFLYLLGVKGGIVKLYGVIVLWEFSYGFHGKIKV